jgi:type I restriction enzyme, S subunit
MSAETQKNIPVLRFSEFSGAWEEEELGELGKFRGGGTPDTTNAEYWIGNIPWISSSDILDDSIQKISISRTITDKAIKDSATKIIPVNSILIVSRVGVGKLAVSNIALCTSQDFSNFTPQSDNALFIAYYLNKHQTKLLSLCQGTSIKGLTVPDLQSLKIDIPSPEEQKKIAAFLSVVDERIEYLTQKKALLEQYKKGMMQKLFSQEIRFKDDSGNTFPDWEEKRLGDVLQVGSGRDYKHLKSGDIPVYGTGGYMTSVNKFLYDGESVCIGRKGTINKPMYLNEKFWTVDTLFYTHSFSFSVPKFIYAIFQTINWKKHNEASGVPSLSKTTIEKIKRKIPSVPEQKKIADFLSSLDDRIDFIATELSQGQEFKKGLLQQMFV